jgi:hypothetical protein
MNIVDILSWSGVTVLILFVMLFWAFTLAGQSWLRPVMFKPRAFFMAMGIATILAIAIVEPTISTMSALLVGVAFTTYALRNQWVVSRTTPILKAPAVSPGDDALVAILPDGNAVALSILARTRVSAYQDMLIVHCGLARSLSLFQVQDPANWFARLPHNSGFEISDGAGIWDGVDGSAINTDHDLERLEVGLCTFSNWRFAYPQATLLSISNREPPVNSARTPHLPGARSVKNAMELGQVDGENWRPLGEGDRTGSRYTLLLARWSADVRDLSIGESAAISGDSPQ